MLFHAEEDLQPNMQLEINLVLPVEIAGLAATEVVCRGEVVRTVETPGSKVMPDTGSQDSAVSLSARIARVPRLDLHTPRRIPVAAALTRVLGTDEHHRSSVSLFMGDLFVMA